MAFVSTLVRTLRTDVTSLDIETNGAPFRGAATVRVRALLVVMTQSDKPLLHFLLLEFEPRLKFIAALHNRFLTSFPSMPHNAGRLCESPKAYVNSY